MNLIWEKNGITLKTEIQRKYDSSALTVKLTCSLKKDWLYRKHVIIKVFAEYIDNRITLKIATC